MAKNYIKLNIGICGESGDNVCGVEAYDNAKILGNEIAKNKAILITSATEGFSLWSSIGAKEENGFVVSISPAANKKEHEEVYRLSDEYTDLMIFSGFGFPGRDLLFIRSCDAIVIGCGQRDLIYQFSLAMHSNKPIGVLEGDWYACNAIKIIMSETDKNNNNVIFEKDPKILVDKLIEKIKN